MKQQEHTGLSFSLFCSKSVWHILLAKAIKPFLLKYKFFFVAYAIEFNYTCGENIRLTLWCKKNHAKNLSLKSDLFFKTFFLDTKLPSRDIKLPIDGIFLPFDFNTIRYGLFAPDSPNVVSGEFSNIIIDVLGENEIDDETIITFAIYLYLGLMRTQKDYNIREPLVAFTKVVPSDNGNISPQFLTDKYEAHKALLLEIYDEVIFGKRSSLKKNTPWLDRWLGLCEDRFNQDTEPAIVWASVSLLLSKQLGVSDNMNLLIDYFLKHVAARDIK